MRARREMAGVLLLLAAAAVAVSPATAATTTTGYGQCAAANSPYKVELSRVIERRSEYCWTIRAAACTPGPANGNRCCGDVPDTFVLRGLDPACVAPGRTTAATVKLGAKSLGPVQIRASPADEFRGETVLRVALPANVRQTASSARGVRICVTLSGTCGKLGDLIRGRKAPEDAWQAALLDGDTKCCSEFSAGPAAASRPPPPPKPARNRSPRPPPRPQPRRLPPSPPPSPRLGVPPSPPPAPPPRPPMPPSPPGAALPPVTITFDEPNLDIGGPGSNQGFTLDGFRLELCAFAPAACPQGASRLHRSVQVSGGGGRGGVDGGDTTPRSVPLASVITREDNRAFDVTQFRMAVVRADSLVLECWVGATRVATETFSVTGVVRPATIRRCLAVLVYTRLMTGAVYLDEILVENIRPL